jgi:hypothetical protein
MEAPVTVVTMDMSAEPGDGLGEQLVPQLAQRAWSVTVPHRGYRCLHNARLDRRFDPKSQSVARWINTVGAMRRLQY